MLRLDRGVGAAQGRSRGLLTATGTLGAIGYGGWALADRFWTHWRTSAKPLGSPPHTDGTKLAPVRGLPAQQRVLELANAADGLIFRARS